MLDAYLRKTAEQEDHAIHLIFSANRWEKKDLILNKLRAGCTLVVDRYLLHNLKSKIN